MASPWKNRSRVRPRSSSAYGLGSARGTSRNCTAANLWPRRDSFFQDLRRSCCDRRHRNGGVTLTLGRNRVVPAMCVAFTTNAFFFDVNDLARAGNVAVSAHHTTARQRREPQNANDAHRTIPLDTDTKQASCRSSAGQLSWGNRGARAPSSLGAWHFLHRRVRSCAHKVCD